MAPPIPLGQPFVMPMFRDFVPQALRPCLYVLFLVLFQLTGCYYLGAAQQITGTTGLMHTDVMFIGLCNVVGVNMPFPFLFRFKFRFTNHQLLLNAAIGIAVCNWLALQTTWLPALCLLSFVAGFLKLCGTFECASNIQLWMTPKRDFAVFFPILYIMVVGDIFLQGWLASVISYYYSWQHVNWAIILMMLFVALAVFVLTKNWHFLPKRLPMVSLDWLGCALWSAVMVEVVWLFNYGEYYNWWDSSTWRLGTLYLLVTLWLCIGRMRHIRHPYISPDVFRYKTLFPLLALYFVAEWLNTTPKVLGNAFTGGILHWGFLTASRFELVGWAGTLLGCLFTLWWMKGLKLKYTSLLIIGGIGLVCYQVMMYLYVTPTLSIGYLYLPLLLRAFGYAIYFTALTIYLEELLPFQPFFMGLTLTGLMRNGPVEAMMSGTYEYWLRHQTAENLVRGINLDPASSVLVSIRQLYGITCWLGIAFLLALALWNVQPVRQRLKRIPLWSVLGRLTRLQLRRI